MALPMKSPGSGQVVTLAHLVDLLVDLDDDRDVLDLSGLILDLEEALGRRVDVLERDRAAQSAPTLLRDAVAL